MALRSYGLNRAQRTWESIRLTRIGREASIAPGVRLDRTTQLRGALAGLTLSRGVSIGRFVDLRIESDDAYLSVGENSAIHDLCILRTQGGHIELGKCVSLNPFSILYGHGGVDIGDNVRIAARVTIVAESHRFKDPDVPIREQGTIPLPVRIEDDVWVGTGAVILGGVSIGRGAIIGAGAVVNRDVRSLSIVGGVPAKEIGTRGQSPA